MTQLCIKSKDHDTLKVLCPLPTYRIGAVSARGSQLGRKKTFYWTTPPTNNPPRFSFPANSVQPHHGNDRFRSEPFLSNSTIFSETIFCTTFALYSNFFSAVPKSAFSVSFFWIPSSPFAAFRLSQRPLIHFLFLRSSIPPNDAPATML